MEFTSEPWFSWLVQSVLLAGAAWWIRFKIEAGLDVKLAKMTSDLRIEEHVQSRRFDRHVQAIDEIRDATGRFFSEWDAFRNMDPFRDGQTTLNDFTGFNESRIALSNTITRHGHFLPEDLRALLLQLSNMASRCSHRVLQVEMMKTYDTTQLSEAQLKQIQTQKALNEHSVAEERFAMNQHLDEVDKLFTALVKTDKS